MTRAFILFVPILMVVAAITGCGGTYDASVCGVATLDNKPLSAGTVIFNPQQAGPSAYGLIAGNGAYSMMTGREEGLPVGSYVVTVVANEPSKPNPNPSLPAVIGKPITPAWYRDPSTTPLKFNVESGSNTINLELTTKPPSGSKTAGK
jgi:hypothetical protein